MLLHGSFDFVLMVAAFYESLKASEEGQDEDQNQGSDSEEITTEDLAAELPSLISGLVFVIIGCIYYGFASRAQNQRLIAMDNAATDQSSLLV